jgi:hypothetical protein
MAPLTLITVWMAVYDPQLLERRLRAGPSAERTAAQKRFTAVAPFVGIIAVVIMAFDHRFGWSPAVPAWLSLVGDALVALGIVIYFLVMGESICRRDSGNRRGPDRRLDGSLRGRPASHVLRCHPISCWGAYRAWFLVGIPLYAASSAASCGDFWMRRNFSARICRDIRSTRARCDTASCRISGSRPGIR